MWSWKIDSIVVASSKWHVWKRIKKREIEVTGTACPINNDKTWRTPFDTLVKRLDIPISWVLKRFVSLFSLLTSTIVLLWFSWSFSIWSPARVNRSSVIRRSLGNCPRCWTTSSNNWYCILIFTLIPLSSQSRWDRNDVIWKSAMPMNINLIHRNSSPKSPISIWISPIERSSPQPFAMMECRTMNICFHKRWKYSNELDIHLRRSKHFFNSANISKWGMIFFSTRGIDLRV